MPAPTLCLTRFAAGLCIAVIAMHLMGCGSGGENAADHRPIEGSAIRVFVSVQPQKTVVERVGGKHVEVQAMVEAGGDPHNFSATAKQMVALGHAEMYLTIGMPLEDRYLPRIRKTRPDLPVISMLTGIDLMGIDPHHRHDEADDEAHADHEDELDTHAWLSPALLKVMARNVSGALSAADPDHAADYEANLAAFERELDALDARIRAKLNPHKGKAFHVFHPAFSYFAEAYGLEQKAIESGGQKPSPKELARLIKEMKEAGAKVIFTQPQFDDTPARAIAGRIGASVASIDPLNEDVTGNLERIADALDQGFRRQL